jgi:hypothetical protein
LRPAPRCAASDSSALRHIKGNPYLFPLFVFQDHGIAIICFARFDDFIM